MLNTASATQCLQLFVLTAPKNGATPKHAAHHTRLHRITFGP